ncbi:unnamed protein product [Nezara viridula]|uniref:Fatty acid desaturase domain-containing protein n=1 Tax=Nezara viridula TaxID=85310 RepID=A0A9P0HNY6_NEZVI|nr:unnamed protein product [Nezara viridula]
MWSISQLKICTLQDLDDTDNAENIDFSFLSALSIDYSQVKWKNAAVLVALHVGAVIGWALFLLGYVHWPTFLWNFLLSFVSVIGITVGALSLWNHKIYDSKKPLKLFLLIAQTIASQDCMWMWIRDHRLHCENHKTDADPFNSKRGFFFSHMGWLMMKKHPDVITKGKQSDMSDLEADSLVMFQKRYRVFNIYTFIITVTVCFNILDSKAVKNYD